MTQGAAGPESRPTTKTAESTAAATARRSQVTERAPSLRRRAQASGQVALRELPGPLGRMARGQVRARPAWRWLLLAGYTVQLVVVSTRHEPWFDEAQAWLLARDLSLWELMAGQLRYEGTPGLWHLLLMPLAKLGLPYEAMQVLTVMIALAGAYVLVRHGPFPLPITGLLLFSFVIGYQYAVVARSYVLLPLLLFLLARAWPERATRVTGLTVVLVLLANVSVHGLLIAGSLSGVHLWERWRERQRMERALARRHLQAAAVLAGVGALLIAQLWPPPDLLVGGGANLDVTTWPAIAVKVYNSSLTGSYVFSALAVALSAWWFHRAGTLALWALPTAALLALSVVKYHNYWHDGVPFLVWIFAFWVSFERWPPDDAARRLSRLVGLAALSGVLVVHAVWWANSAAHDLTSAYSGSPAAAAYLADEGLADGTVWATSFHSLGIQPYFDRNIFDNYADGAPDRAYWHWSKPPLLEDSRRALIRAQPDTIVWGIKFPEQRRLPTMRGYEVIATFEGDLFWKNRIVERDAFVILRRG